MINDLVIFPLKIKGIGMNNIYGLNSDDKS